MRETRQFRGISKRLAVSYLENLGGERVDEAGDRVEGEDWSAELSSETVNPMGSFQLSEVTVDFEGEAAALESIIDGFARKAMRAGG